MGEGFYPAAQQIQQPDILGQYLRGRAAPMQMEAMQQGNALGGLQIDQLRQILQGQQFMAQAWDPSGVPQAATQGGVGAGASPMGAPPQGSTYGGAQPGLSAPTQAIIGSLSPNMGKLLAGTALTGGDPFAKAKEAQEYQLQQGQLAWRTDNSFGGEGFLKEMTSSSDAPVILKRNWEQLKGLWPQLAFAAGVDARNIDDPHTVNKVAAHAYNQRAIPLGMPPIEAAKRYEQTAGPLGSIYQRELNTGQTTQLKAEEPLKDVVGPDGKPTNLRASLAEGRQPFNQSIFGAANISDQAKEFAYQRFATTGEMPTGMGRSPAMQAAMLNYFAQRAQQEGNSAAAIAAKGQAFKATQGVLKDYESGATSKTLNGINTAVQHMAALDPLIDNLGNTASPAFNTAANFFKKQTGSSAPTSYTALKEFVGGEVAKAVLPGGGGEAERQALTAPLNAANSPEQLKQAVQTVKTALAGKTEALRNQWDIGTNGTQGDFNKFLLPETKRALGLNAQPERPGQHPPDVQALLDKYK